MFELTRNYLDKNERKFFMKIYNEIIKEYDFNDIPTAYLMFLRFIEEWKSFYKKLSEKNCLSACFESDIIDVKIIYSK